MPRIRFLASVIVAAAVLSAASPAGAAGPGTVVGPGLLTGPADAPAAVARGGAFTFYGSGYGHGIGLSQWGAYGLAKKGWSYGRILTHFYSGTKVNVAAKPVKKIRVELTYDRRKVHLTPAVAPVRLTVGAPGRAGTRVAMIPVGATWTVNSSNRGYAVRDGAGTLIGGKYWGGRRTNLYATYADRGGRVFVPEADAIWHQGFTYARGYLEFNQYRCGARGCLERVVMPIAFESYLLGIGEMPSSWPSSALRTQAVAARTYASYSIRHYGLRASCNCHLSDGANDQTYVGYAKEQGAAGARWTDAVRATAGRVVTYRGALIQSFFAASDGGHSEDIEDAWHGGNNAYAIPYLRGVCDPGEYNGANPWTNWQYSFSASELTSRLGPYTSGVGTVSGFPKVRRGTGGRIIEATVRGSAGSDQVSGSALRAALGLPDDRIWINRNRNVLGAVRSEYDRVMCRPGLPSTAVLSVSGGARQRFQTGGIYRNNGADVTVWLRGPIDAEYVGVGGATGRLGLPTTNVASVGRAAGAVARACSSCRRIVLEHGRIFFKSGAGAHALWGPVLDAYLAHGGTAGSLGFPTSRVRTGTGGTDRATFEHGQIACPPSGSCTVS